MDWVSYVEYVRLTTLECGAICNMNRLMWKFTLIVQNGK